MQIDFPTPGKPKPQMAAAIYSRSMTSMKNLLRMGEYKYGGKGSEGFRFYKSQVMDQFYFMLQDIFIELNDRGIIRKCGCGCTIEKRSGYEPCKWCNGSGYKNTKEYNDHLDNIDKKASK